MGYWQKIQALAQTDWLLNPPRGLISARCAFEWFAETNICLMAVAWWGSEDNPLPAGYTRFTFDRMQPEPEHFAITLHDEGRKSAGRIHQDDVVLIYRPDMHRWGSGIADNSIVERQG